MGKLSDKAEAVKELAITGAAIGSPFGPVGVGVGGSIGAGLGLLVGDETTVFPIDMVAIPAYQAYMLQGTPALTIYIKAGETLVPTGGNVQDMNENMNVSEVASEGSIQKKKPKLTKWNRYVKNKKNHIRYKSGPNKGKLNLSAMAKKGGFGGKKR